MIKVQITIETIDPDLIQYTLYCNDVMIVFLVALEMCTTVELSRRVSGRLQRVVLAQITFYVRIRLLQSRLA
jgi:hypothetical protein